jgi:two-component system CheB/CheR fusion protein
MQYELFFGGVAKQDPELLTDFVQIKTQLADAVALTRRLSVYLSPPILYDEGLTQAIGWLVSQMRDQYGLQIELLAKESFAIPDPDLQVLLYSSVRELLFNVVKHARVSRAFVNLERSSDELVIEVRDEGVGFDPFSLSPGAGSGGEENGDGAQTGFGLPTLFHRLSLFDGRMEIASTPGAGTRVRITIPVYAGKRGD